eukprot:TRINITY_DN18298_c0_g1_i3.p1 TRINITY_DN18298_c0_g1~~TRINITY_DN18298_c0_g1_i3.p1  ORF type:complete len:117 (-),score=19.56 TRINITY_DN18298_c0_g1_i3:788-1138(-)
MARMTMLSQESLAPLVMELKERHASKILLSIRFSGYFRACNDAGMIWNFLKHFLELVNTGDFYGNCFDGPYHRSVLVCIKCPKLDISTLARDFAQLCTTIKLSNLIWVLWHQNAVS